MSVESRGRGDPTAHARPALGPPRAGQPRTPSPGSAVGAIVRAAIAIADADGLGPPSSMRRGRDGAGRRHDVALPPRAGQGRAGRPHARRRLRRVPATHRARRWRAPLERLAACGGRSSATRGAASARDAAGARPERARQLRVAPAGRQRPPGSRSGDVLNASSSSPATSRARRRSRANAALEAERRTGVSDEEWWSAPPVVLGGLLPARALPDADLAVGGRRVRDAPPMRSSSVSSACWTGCHRPAASVA